MIPTLAELARFLRYLLTPEAPVAAVHYDCAAAGAAKAGLWICLAVAAGIALAHTLGQGA
jgi:hypothetical protein